MSRYEVEIKSLLGAKEHADALKEKMCKLDPSASCISKNTQLNHYFEGGDTNELYTRVKDLFSKEAQEKLAHIVEVGSNFSIRTRQRNDEVLLVLKASVDEGTSANTISRLEFEEPVSVSLEELDRLVESAGYTYQAKWSREREEYTYKGANVCIDRNAGYGFLAEFEKVTDAESDVTRIRDEIKTLMAELGAEELPQDRLERMFAHYNQNWAEYYGTDKTFTIE